MLTVLLLWCALVNENTWTTLSVKQRYCVIFAMSYKLT